MIFPDKYKINKKYPKKLFLDNKEIESKDRTFIKKHIVSVELVAQISGEDIPSVDNEDYKYKVIQYLEVELDDIKYAKDMGVIFQNIFKSPLIVKFYDKNGYYSYSYALKRISKVKIFIPKDENKCVGVVSIGVDGYLSDEVGQILNDEYEICVRTGFHCAPLVHDFIDSKLYNGTVRISMSYFTTKEEIDCLIKAIKSL